MYTEQFLVDAYALNHDPFVFVSNFDCNFANVESISPEYCALSINVAALVVWESSGSRYLPSSDIQNMSKSVLDNNSSSCALVSGF